MLSLSNLCAYSRQLVCVVHVRKAYFDLQQIGEQNSRQFTAKAGLALDWKLHGYFVTLRAPGTSRSHPMSLLGHLQCVPKSSRYRNDPVPMRCVRCREESIIGISWIGYKCEMAYRNCDNVNH